MKNVWIKMAFLISGILALVGVNTPSAQATALYHKQIAEVKQTTPLYLRLAPDIAQQINKHNPHLQMTQHWSHSSHVSHGSHQSHQSHYSSR
jgi:predicted choloylglycine hydrolase